LLKKLINTKFKKDLAFSYFTQGITIGLGFIQLFLINRYFGVETYGQLAIIMSTAGIFSALLTARSSEAITRFFTN
jgi:O-antigen/teichoic acid export membrane protein